MFDRPDIPHWPAILRPLAEAERALGRLAHALEATPIHQAWLWRETVRMAARISQFSGYRVQSTRLMQGLAGVPLAPAEDDTGLAAARRVFLIAAPLFRTQHGLDSQSDHLELFAPLWGGYQPDGSSDALSVDESPRPDGEPSDGHPTKVARAGDEDKLTALVRELAGFAGLEARPPLLDLFLELRQHESARRLPASLARLALPLALHQAGVVPKAAPGLLGGRLSLTSTEGEGVTPWLTRGLGALAKEATAASRRLHDLTGQHRAWHACLTDAGLRGHSRAPAVLDLLAATPVLSASLVARHLGCSAMGASKILRRLLDLGTVIEATPRTRWKIYLASDLAAPDRDLLGAEAPLSLSEPPPAIDREAVEASLDALYGDLERLDRRAKATLASNDPVQEAGEGG